MTSPARSCPVDVVVLGADALGAATAWSLARAGASVVLLDPRTPRQLRLAVRGAAWSAHPAWTTADEHARNAAAWREVERTTGAALLTGCPALDDDGLRPGSAAQVRADHAVAALTAAAAGAGVQVRHRTATGPVLPEGDRVVVDTDAGPVRARRAVVTAVDASAVPGIELHFTPHRTLPAALIARHDPELGLVRAVPCAQGHLAVGATGRPRGTVHDLRDHVRRWFPEVDAGHPEPVGPDVRSTGSAELAARLDGPVLTATSTAAGSVDVVVRAHELAAMLLGAAAPARPRSGVGA